MAKLHVPHMHVAICLKAAMDEREKGTLIGGSCHDLSLRELSAFMLPVNQVAVINDLCKSLINSGHEYCQSGLHRTIIVCEKFWVVEGLISGVSGRYGGDKMGAVGSKPGLQIAGECVEVGWGESS